MHRLLLATRNRHKTSELAALLGAEFQVEDLTTHPELPEVEETGVTFLENATLKALASSRHFGADMLVLAGPGAPDADNTALLLARLENTTERTARFRCVIAVARGGELAASFDGACEGRIIDAPRGCEGFGYDPVFVPEGDSKTFAQLPAEMKNRISHRAKATGQALAWLSGCR